MPQPMTLPTLLGLNKTKQTIDNLPIMQWNKWRRRALIGSWIVIGTVGAMYMNRSRQLARVAEDLHEIKEELVDEEE